jgi:hypothetical protein
MRNMIAVAHEELQRVCAGGQIDHRFRLSHAEMQVVLIVRYRFIHVRRISVDQQVMVTGIRLERAGRSNPEVAGPKPYLDVCRSHDGSFGWPSDIDIGISRNRSSPMRLILRCPGAMVVGFGRGSGLRERWSRSDGSRQDARQSRKAPRCHVGEKPHCMHLPNDNRDLLGVERRALRNMLIVSEQELERVTSGRQLKSRFGLACPEM